jgi:DNA-binding response OmpR family regulator
MIRCPNCGYSHTGRTYAPEIEAVRMPRRQADVILRLRQAAGGVVTNAQLIDFVYGDQPDGGPESASFCIQSYICKARPKIQAVGWTVTVERHIGYRLVRVAA